MNPIKSFHGFILIISLVLCFSNSLPVQAQTFVDSNFAPAITAPFQSGQSLTRAWLQPDGKVLVSGTFQSVNGIVSPFAARLESNGSLDTSFQPPSNVPLMSAVSFQHDGRILFTAGSRVRRLHPNGTLDETFYAEAKSLFTLNSYALYGVLAEPDGKILVHGSCLAMNEIPCSQVARLHANGSLDSAFRPALDTSGFVQAILRQSDGKLIIGGMFSNVENQPRRNLARLNPNGTLDRTFNPGSGCNRAVYALALQSDGQILVGGAFTTFDGTNRSGIVRVNSDGSLDASFNPGAGVGSTQVTDGVFSIFPQPGGAIYLSGVFTSYDGIPRWNVARVHSNGNLDTGFGETYIASPPQAVYCTAQIDGKLIISGGFPGINGTAQAGVARLETNGSMDLSFRPRLESAGAITALAVRSNGDCLIAGNFTSVNGVARSGLAALTFEGTLDSSFSPLATTDSPAAAICVQPDRKIILGGSFRELNHSFNPALVRIDENGLQDPTFNSWAGIAAVDFVTHLALQADSKIVAAGSFLNTRAVARFDSNGQMDRLSDLQPAPGYGFTALAVQENDKILVGGSTMTTTHGYKQIGLVRLEADCSLDYGFLSELGVPGDGGGVVTIAVQPDGKILVAGALTTSPLQTNRITALARLHSNGRLDRSFTNLFFPLPFYSSGVVRAIGVQFDGKIMIAGSFESIHGFKRKGMARLNFDGTLDHGFEPVIGGEISLMSLDTLRGSVLIGGTVTGVEGLPRAGLARLFTTPRPDSGGSRLRMVGGRWTEAGFQFLLRGLGNHQVDLEASNDLKEWQFIRRTPTWATSEELLTDYDAPGQHLRRFYRMRVVP